MSFLLTLAVTSLIIFLALKFLQRLSSNGGSGDGKLIPGPTFLETVRGFRAQQTQLHLLFMDWAKIFGNLFICNLGTQRLVILNDHKLIKEAFANPHIHGRPEIAPGNPFRLPKNGIIRNEGDSWAFQRKVSLRHLKNFGFGTGGVMEKLMMEEIMELVHHFEDSKKQDVNIKRQFFFPTMNAVWIVMASLRLGDELKDKETKKIFLDFFHSLECVAANPLMVLIPSFVDYFPWIPTWSKYVEVSQKVRSFISKIVTEHKNRMNDSVGDAENFVFAYLKDNCLIKSDEESTTNVNKFDPEAEQQLEAILMDFVFAGFETTSTQMEWVVYHLVNNQDCQAKIQQELDRVIGTSGRLPTLADRPKLPYTEACILESMRLTPIVPIGVMHETTADTKVCGFEIKKSTTVISNLYGAQHDPTVVKDPETFRPERFLSEDKTTVVPQPFLMPFSVGKRFCLGEFVAKDSMFLLVSAIFKKFHVRPPTTSRSIGKSNAGGVLLSPGDFYATFHRRD